MSTARCFSDISERSEIFRFNPVFNFLSHWKTTEPQSLIQQGVKVRCRKKRAVITVQNIASSPLHRFSHTTDISGCCHSICGTVLQLFSDFPISGSLPLPQVQPRMSTQQKFSLPPRDQSQTNQRLHQNTSDIFSLPSKDLSNYKVIKN